jgi:hypothetical protein
MAEGMVPMPFAPPTMAPPTLPAAAPAPMSALASGHDFLQTTIGQHPAITAAIMAALVIIAMVLVYALVQYRGCAHGAEGMAAGPPTNPCPMGTTPVNYQNPDGSMMTWCKPGSALPGPATVCTGSTWDPAAEAEAQALGTVGSFQHDSYGEAKLQHAINEAYDANVGLSDEQLATLMQQGGAP